MEPTQATSCENVAKRVGIHHGIPTGRVGPLALVVTLPHLVGSRFGPVTKQVP
jgi:hypothetical protein